MPESVSTTFSCSALCKCCAWAASTLACRTAAFSARRWFLSIVSRVGSASLCGLMGLSEFLGAGDSLDVLPLVGTLLGLL